VGGPIVNVTPIRHAKVMEQAARDGVHVIAEASKARALLAVLVPLLFPVILILAFAKSGHSVSDYPRLIADGDLSLFRQGVMWLALAAFVLIYVPAALRALTAPLYLASSDGDLIVPTGERFPLDKIESISLRKTFWHKIMTIRAEGKDRRVVVTFAKQLAGGIREALRASPYLAGVIVT